MICTQLGQHFFSTYLTSKVFLISGYAAGALRTLQIKKTCTDLQLWPQHEEGMREKCQEWSNLIKHSAPKIATTIPWWGSGVGGGPERTSLPTQRSFLVMALNTGLMQGLLREDQHLKSEHNCDYHWRDLTANLLGNKLIMYLFMLCFLGKKTIAEVENSWEVWTWLSWEVRLALNSSNHWLKCKL